MITRKNYEIYFIDLLEGNLSNKEKEYVLIFLEQNPDLKEELDLLNLSVLNIEPEIQTSDFSYLKKQQAINSENEDEFFIGKLEGDLSNEEEKLLLLYLKENPVKQVVFESFQNTKLTPVINLFPNKNKLKKQRGFAVIFTLASGVAAALLALVIFNINTETTIYQANVQRSDWKLETPIARKNNEPKKMINTKIDLNPVLSVKKSKTIKAEPSKRKKEIIAKEEISILNVVIPKDPEVLANQTPIDYPIEEVPSTKKNVFSPKEFAEEKTKELIQNKTGEEVENRNDLLAIASKKVKEDVIPKFVDVETKKVDNQRYRTIRIGKKFSIKHKIKK